MTQYSPVCSLSVAASSAGLDDDVSKCVIHRHISVGISLLAQRQKYPPNESPKHKHIAQCHCHIVYNKINNTKKFNCSN